MRLLCPWNFPGKNTGVSCHFLLQGIFPTQGSNPGLLHCRQIPYQLSCQGSPRILEWVAYPFSSGSSRPRKLYLEEGSHSGKESACQSRRRKRCKFNPWVGKIPWSKKWHPTLVFLPRKFHGLRSLMDYSPWGCKKSDMTEHTQRQISNHYILPVKQNYMSIISQ